MEHGANLLLIGLSHRTALIASRERYAIKPEDLATCLESVHGIQGVREVFALSTCNRTEILVCVEAGADPRSDIVTTVFRNIEAKELYTFRGVQAVIHLFRVASGLDSLVLGESEILGQLRRSYDVAREAGTLGAEIDPLLRQALRVGKRARSETELGLGTLSVARVGVDIAAHVYGSFEHCHALILGAGETGVLTARHLVEHKVGKLSFCNRTLDKAETAAVVLGGSAHTLDELPTLLKQADIVLACVDAQEAVLRREHFDRRAVARRDRPLLIVDLSVPRAVEAEVAQLENLLLYDLDDLDRVVEENRRGREAATDATAGMLVTEVHKYYSLRTFASFSPAIDALRARFEELREEVLDDVCGEKSNAEAVRVAHDLQRKLLDAALVQMKESARRTRSEAALRSEYRRFLEDL